MERFLEYFVPEKYALNLGINKYDKKIGGTVSVTGVAKNETVKFHAVGLSVKEVFVNDEKADFKVEDGVLTLKKVPLGDVMVLLRYEGALNENMQGAYLSTYKYDGETEVIVATQFESHYAREAFPCIDEPGAKAIFELKLTVPESEDIVLANTPVKETKKHFKVPDGKYTIFYNDEGKKVASKYVEYVFEETPRMSTYLLAWVIGRFHGKTVKNKHGVLITTYCSLAQDIDSVDFANEIACRSLEFYDDNFGVPYPLEKLDQVALPDFEAGAMENWGLVTYRESMLLASKKATLGTKKSIALTVAHELSHQWFGDLVTMKWWDDLWLNESFASVMEYYAVDYIHPEYKIFESFFLGDCYSALFRDANDGVQSVHQDVNDPEEIATLFDGAIVYAKGARLMLMLIRLMGWENFLKGIRDYFKKYQYKNTIGDDLWEALKPYADFNPKELMHAFIDRPGYPVITSKNGDFKDYEQKRFLMNGEMKKSDWPIPEITEDMSGHYILNLSEEEFNERLDKFSELSLEEKLRLLMDRDFVTKVGLQSPVSLIQLALKFKNEDKAAVWTKISSIISNLKMYFDDDSKEEKVLKKYVLDLVSSKLDEIGLVTRKDDDENTIRLRANLLALDYYAEDMERLKKLAEMYDEDYMKMDSEVRDDILDAKIYLEPKIIDDYLEKYKEMADPEAKFDYLSAMTSVKDVKYAEKVLALLGDIETVKPQDQFYLFIFLYRNFRTRKKAFSWLKENWEFVRKFSGDKSMDSYPKAISTTMRTKEELEEYRDFFSPMKNELALKRAITIGESSIQARIEQIEKEKKAVYQGLKKYFEIN